MKKIFISLILFTAMTSLFASGGGDTKEEYKRAIAVVMDNSEGTFQKAWIRTITLFAHEQDLGVQVFSTGGSISTMENQVNEILQDKRFKGLIAATENSALADTLTLAANAAGKPIILWGSTVTDPENLSAVSVLYPQTGGYREGIDYGLSKVQKRNGSLYPAFIVGSRGFTDSLDPRWNIFSKRLRAYDEIARAVVIPAESTDEKTAEAVRKALIENKTINILFLSADYIEVIKPYLISSGMWVSKEDPVHTPIICFDGGKEAIGYLEEGYIDVIVSRDLWKEVQSAMEIFLDAIENEKVLVQQGFQISGILLTRESITENDKRVWIEGYVPPPPPEEVEKEQKRKKPSEK